MAPVDLQMVLVDYRGQILENCEFLITKNEFISIITPKEPSGKFKAIALRTVKHSEKREPLIASDPSGTVQEAIASLHTKSSEAAHLYIVTNGYAEPRDLDEVKSDKLDDDDGDEDEDDEDDNTSVVSSDSASSTNAPSVWSATSDTAAEVPTPVSIIHAASASSRTTRPAALPSASKSAKKKSKATNDRKARKAPSAPVVRKTYDDYFTEDDEDNAGPPRIKIVHPVRQAAPPSSGAAGHHNTPRQQPPPPPSWTMGLPPPPPFRSYGGKLVNNYGPLSQPGPPPPSMSLHPQYAQAHGMPPPPPPQQQSSMIHRSSSLPGPPAPPGAGPAPPHMGGNGGSLNNVMGPPGAPPPISASSTVTTPPHLQQQQQAKHQQAALSHTNYHNNASNSRIVSLTPPRLHDVRLTITWLHHSSARTLETVRPSLRALQDAALAYVHNNPHAFENLSAADMALPPHPHPSSHPSSQAPAPMPVRPGGVGVRALRATVKRAWFDDESWDLANYRGGDDLTRLFASLGQGTIPRLEIEVDYPRP